MTKKRMSFRDKISQNAKKENQKRSNYGYLDLPKGVQIYKETPGARAFLDILPYEVTCKKHPDNDEVMGIAIPGEVWYKRPFKVHRNVGSSGANGKGETVVCLSSFGKKCPVCEYRAKRIREGADKDETDMMKISYRNLYAVIPLKDKAYEEKVHIWDISQYLFQNLLNDELDEDPDNAIFPDYEEGLTLKIRFDSTTIAGSKPFAEASRIDFVEREESYEEVMLDKTPKLDDVLHEMTYEQLEKIFFELDDENATKGDTEPEEENKEETKPIRRKKKVVKEEKEPEPEPEETQEEQEEVPVTTRRKRTQKPDEPVCPFKHVFGKDTDSFEDCDECAVWDSCLDKKEEDE